MPLRSKYLARTYDQLHMLASYSNKECHLQYLFQKVEQENNTCVNQETFSSHAHHLISNSGSSMPGMVGRFQVSQYFCVRHCIPKVPHLPLCQCSRHLHFVPTTIPSFERIIQSIFFYQIFVFWILPQL